MSTPYAEKFTTPYSAAEVQLIVRLRSLDPPVGWTQIQREHFPTRTAAALKAKVYNMDESQRPPLGKPGRAKGSPPSANAIDREDWADDAREASLKLALAVSALAHRYLEVGA